MPIDPPLMHAPRYPFTALVALGAGIVSMTWWTTGHLAGVFDVSAPIEAKPWALLASTLPHANPVHLIFNLMWWWPLGARLEGALGGPKAVGVFVLLAVLSSAAEFAIFSGGVGLSGVVYGLCTLLWVLQRKYPSLEGAVTKQTMQVFGIWFLLCIVFTLTDTMAIANVAHGVGALAGWLLGRCIIAERRAVPIAAVVAAGVLIALGATVARPVVNFSQEFRGSFYRGAVAFREGRYEEAAQHFEAANSERPHEPAILINLGSTYHELGRDAEALAMYRRAVELDPSERGVLGPYVAALIDIDAKRAVEADDFELAKALIEESLSWYENGVYPKQLFSWMEEEERRRGIVPQDP